MANISNKQGKHARQSSTEPSVRPAVYTDVSKASSFNRNSTRRDGSILKSIFTFLFSFILGLAIIFAASGFAYVQVKNIDLATTSPLVVAQDMYHAIYAKFTGQDYQSIFDETTSEPSNSNYTSLPNIQAVEDSSTSSSQATSSSIVVEEADPALPTPLIAEFDGVKLHSLVRAAEVSAIMFHQASFDYAHVLETKLPEIDPEKVMHERKVDIPAEQPTGDEYMNAPAMHVWRQEVTALDTSIDVGCAAFSEVLAPVDGTVVLVREYDLFDQMKDFEVHIQPTSRHDLDAVVIHLVDVSVKAGDKVVGGVTPIAKARDIVGEGLIDIQLGVFVEAHGGNHCHVQINNADSEGYREKRLKDAYEVKE